MQPKSGGPEWLGLSPVIWLLLGGGLLLYGFTAWENRRIVHGAGPEITTVLMLLAALRASLGALALITVLALFFTRGIPPEPPANWAG